MPTSHLVVVVMTSPSGNCLYGGQMSRTEHVSGAENGAELAKTRVQQSGAVSGSHKNRAEWSGA